MALLWRCLVSSPEIAHGAITWRYGQSPGRTAVFLLDAGILSMASVRGWLRLYFQWPADPRRPRYGGAKFEEKHLRPTTSFPTARQEA
jgi:hypothetical protein